MPIKCLLNLTALLFLLSVSPAFADDAARPYVELTDAPTITVDWSKGNTQAVTLHGNRILVFENARRGDFCRLIITQDAIGSRTVTWPEAVNWPGESRFPLTLTTTAKRKDYITFFYNGVTYDSLAASQNY